MIKLASFWFAKMRNQVSPLGMAVHPSVSAELPAIIVYSMTQFCISSWEEKYPKQLPVKIARSTSNHLFSIASIDNLVNKI